MLTLSDAAGAMPGGDATLQVVRRIERGLGSAYRVNGRDVRARDVALLFADAATGAHSPALVSQGRIGAIIAAKPTERRALLEEAAGIAGLHVRRHEAELRLRATEANLARIDDVIAAQTAAAAALRRAAKAAERYRSVSDALQAAERALVVTRWTAARAAATAATDAAAAAATAVDTASATATRLARARDAAAADLPARRETESAAAAALAALVATARRLDDEAAAVTRRTRELAAIAATIAGDRAREDGLARDAATRRRAARRGGRVARSKARRRRRRRCRPPRRRSRPPSARRRWRRPASPRRSRRRRGRPRRRGPRRRRSTPRAAGWRGPKRRPTGCPPCRRPTSPRSLADAMRRSPRWRARPARSPPRTTRSPPPTSLAERAETARDAAADDLRAARDTASGLTAERDALARLDASDGRGASLLDGITVAAGDERAFAAAFGDDLAATLGGGTGRWWDRSDGAVPALPAGAEPLRATVPPELARRLAATGVVDGEPAALAATLLPGQRLVTRDGRLWRWDGFRNAGGAGGEGVAAAERLIRRNRLAALAADLPVAVAAVGTAAAAVAAADADLAAALVAERTARAERATAEREHDAARAAAAAAGAERDRASAAHDARVAAVARLRDDAAGFAREVAAAEAAAADVVGLPGLAAAVVAARQLADAARAALAVARATAAMLERDRDSAAARAAQVAAERADWARRAAASAAQRAELDRRAAAALAEAAQLAGRPDDIRAEQAALAARIADADALRRTAADARAAADAALAGLDREAHAAAEALSTAREARARAAADADHAATRCREIEAACGARFAASPPNLGADPGDADALAAEVTRLTAARDGIGPVNLRADLELAELTAAIDTIAAERAELDTAILRLRGSIGALNREGRVRLRAAFETVNGHFRDLFGTLFAGGAAHLELVESDDPLTAGLEIMAQPPGKKLQSLTLLSGGEQALTATALIFALFLTTPSPLCVLDEVDAPLDDANVERFCALLDRMAAATATRFLIVTHNAVTMSRMHRLYGVTMAEPGVSQLVSVDLGGAERLLAAE